jgi:hypothetical protein
MIRFILNLKIKQLSKKNMTKKVFLQAAGWVSAFAMVFSVFTPVSANHDPYDGVEMKKIILCHWDASAKPDPAYKSSGDVAVSAAISGHGGHVKDIIPPFHYKGGSYAGLNWDADTEVIWDEGNCGGTSIPDPETATLTLVKTLAGDPTEDVEADWTLTADGGDTISGTTGVSGVVLVGDYDLSEDGPETNYTASDWNCGDATMVDGDTVTLTVDQDVTCTITNTYDAPGDEDPTCVAQEIPSLTHVADEPLSLIVIGDDVRHCAISGTKFEDTNETGIIDDGDLVLEGWTIYLDLNDNGTLDDGERSDITDVDGNYDFADLVAGTYHVREVNQSNWTQVLPADDHEVVLTYNAITGKNFLNIHNEDQGCTRNCGGGSSGGGSRNNDDDDGQVLGESTTLPYVAPQVAGATLPRTGLPVLAIMLVALAGAAKLAYDARALAKR